MDHDATGDDIHEWVQEYYGEILKQSEDLKTNACCAVGAPSPRIARALRNIHDDVLSRFYGCGFPIPEVVAGRTVVDLGCGTGRDVYLLAQFAGPDGMVHGVDMTPLQLEVAERTRSWHAERFGHPASNVQLHQGYIEDLSFLEDDSVDIVVSNCVVNLSPRKDLVMQEIFRILKPGGEFYFSDVFADRRLPKEVAFDPILHSECLGGAMYDFDFEQLAKAVGFKDPRTIERAPITIQNAAIEEKVGAARFSSVTLRLFKLPQLEARCEDYGQIAIYRTPIEGVGPVFTLDDHHVFELNRPERVCGNTAAMLRDTRFADHFEVIGDASVHYGVFDCGPTLAAQQYASGPPASAAASCC
jgi:SAM-dependent methyltransferase